MASVLDLVVPGAGVVADALLKIHNLCAEMQEGQAACTRLHSRLQTILDELQHMATQGQVPASDALDKYTGIVATYINYLERYRGKKMLSRLIRHRKMMAELLAINENVDMLFHTLHLATSAVVMTWRQQWELDRTAQERTLATIVSNDAVVLRELKDTRAQVEALTLLKFEIEQRAARQTADTMRLLKTMYTTVVRGSKTTVKSLPLWFIPEDEVVFESEPFARGSFGSVHHGVWDVGTEVVVKCLLVDASAADERTRRKFENEIDIWHRFNHPNVVKMFGASHVSSPPFIVCEFATNGDLCSFLVRSDDNKLQLWRLLYQAALGLDYVHKQGVVHGDLKLNNILVGADGQAKVSDFGLSSARTASTISKSSTGAPSVCGGLRWRAPECLKRRPTRASDVYSFAMCMIEAVIDEPPFAFLDDEDVREHLRNGEIPEQPDAMSDDVWELVVAMTHRDPAERVAMSHVIERLKALADEGAVGAVSGSLRCIECAYEVSCDATFCASCGTRLTPGPAPAARQTALTGSESARDLMTIIAAGNETERELAALALVRKCGDLEEGKRVCDADPAPLLAQLVGSGVNYRTQLYALDCLCWLRFYGEKKPSLVEFEALQDRIRGPNQQELATLVEELRHGNHEIKEVAAILCACIALTRCEGTLVTAGAIPPLVEFLKTGTNGQRLWATVALNNTAFRGADARLPIARAGAISPLIALVRAGSTVEKEVASFALANLAAGCGLNQMSIARSGGVAVIVGLLCSGSERQKRAAADSLTCLGYNNEANQVAIVREGALPALVTLLNMGGALQKEAAAKALGTLSMNGANYAAITREGAVPGLRALTQTGTAEQRRLAAWALGNLASQEASGRAGLERARSTSAADIFREPTAFTTTLARRRAASSVDKGKEKRGLLGRIFSKR